MLPRAHTVRVITLSEEEVRRVIAEEIASLREEVGALAPRAAQKAWLTNDEACEYLGLSRTTMARLRGAGTLPFSKFRGNVYYALADIEDALASRRQRGGT